MKGGSLSSALPFKNWTGRGSLMAFCLQSLTGFIFLQPAPPPPPAPACLIRDGVVIHRLDERWITESKWIPLFLLSEAATYIHIRARWHTSRGLNFHRVSPVSLAHAVPSSFPLVSLRWSQKPDWPLVSKTHYCARTCTFQGVNC